MMKMAAMKAQAWLMVVHTPKPDRSRICTDSIEPGHINTYKSVKNNVALYAVSLTLGTFCQSDFVKVSHACYSPRPFLQ